jgi:hypothetical protein
MDPKGKKLGRIVHGEAATTNIGFGGNDWRTLFFTTRNTLGSVNLKIPGIPVPVPKKALAFVDFVKASQELVLRRVSRSPNA